MDRRRKKSIEETLELSERMGAMREVASVETDSRLNEMDQKIEGLFQAVQVLSKTVEGMQQLFIKAGEYQGKPRGRLPR